MRTDVFAVVMATGIVSIAAADHGFAVISDGLIVVAAVALPILIVPVAGAWRGFDFRDLDVLLGLFAYVAACAVVAARLAEHRVVLWVLAGISLQGWLSLAPMVVRAMHRQRAGLRDGAHGGWELAAVATSALSIVSSQLGIVFLAVLFWLLGICVYLGTTGLILAHVRRDPAAPELTRPSMWILMGGIAIATLAGDHLHHSLPAGSFADAVRAVTIVTWIVATVWIPALVLVAIRRRVGLGWPAVFPLGMYSSATYAMAIETGWRWMTIVSEAFFWIALLAWLIVVAQLLLRFRRPHAADAPSDPAR